jgi:SAM-dependent methyltransferase
MLDEYLRQVATAPPGSETIVADVPGSDVVDFVRANLPAPPARVLEVGAGDGELARFLTAAGYSVVAIDPDAGSADVLPIPLLELDEPAASFDAAVAVVSLHHVNPLDASFERLADVLRTGATLVVDEFDVERFDERAAGWWLEQRSALGFVEATSARELVADMRAEVHSLSRIETALEAHFDLGRPQRASYLYRWDLDDALRSPEEELIVAGDLPAVGARLIGRRREQPTSAR